MPLCDHQHCDWIRNRREGLFRGDSSAQSDFNDKFRQDLQARATSWLQDSYEAENAAANAIHTFLTKAEVGQLSLDPCPMSYLSTCLRREMYAIWRRRYFVDRSCRILGIRRNGNQALLTVPDHQLAGDEMLEIKDSNCDPKINGLQKIFQIVDENTIQIPVSISMPGNAGSLRLLKSKEIGQTLHSDLNERRPPDPVDHRENERRAKARLLEQLEWAINQLSTDEQLVVRASLNGAKRQEMADELGVKPHQVDYLRVCALERLKFFLERDELPAM